MTRIRVSFCLTTVVAAALGGCASKTLPPTTLRIWQTETDKDAVELLQRMARQFEADHQLVKVEVESVGWSSLGSKLMVAVKTDNLPDLAHLEPFMTASLFQRGLLVPIDDVVDSIQADEEKGGNGPIYSGVLDLQSFNGRRYGIAYAVGTTGFAYRKDVAQKLGLREPKTWKEYLNFREKDEGQWVAASSSRRRPVFC